MIINLCLCKHTHAQRLWWVNFGYFEILILCVCFICFKFGLLCTKLESVGYCLRESIMIHFRHIEICFISFKFCLLCSKLESVRHSLWGTKQHDAIHSSRNLEIACFTTWHSHWNLHNKDFRVFVSQWGPIHIYINENQIPSRHYGVWGCW